MNVLMVISKVKEEHVVDAQTATEKVIQALEQAQPAGVRYAVTMLSDGVTFVALVELESDGGHPLRGFPAYAEMVENLKQWYAEPPAVEKMTVTGSYGLF